MNIDALACFLLCTIVSGCSQTSLPSMSGNVSSLTNEHVPGAILLAKVHGKTQVADMWFHAHSGLEGGRCIKIVAEADRSGAFSIVPKNRGTYFGDPTVKLMVYHREYRHAIDGSRSSLSHSLVLHAQVWPESSATQFNIWTGRAVDRSKLKNAKHFDQLQLSRSDYLDKWLAVATADSCEVQNGSAYEDLIVAVLEDWLESAKRSMPRRYVTCDLLGTFEVNPSLLAKLEAIRDAAKQSVCV